MNSKDQTASETTTPTEATPPPVAPPPPSAAPPDKLAPFRALFGMPVAVQFAAQTPYVQVAPLTDAEGNVQAVQIPNTTRVIGLPAVAEPQQAIAVATGVLRPSEDGTWLIIEERIGIPRSAHSLGGQALMDVYVRPEMITHVSFVKAIELRRPAREADA